METHSAKPRYQKLLRTKAPKRRYNCPHRWRYYTRYHKATVPKCKIPHRHKVIPNKVVLGHTPTHRQGAYIPRNLGLRVKGSERNESIICCSLHDKTTTYHHHLDQLIVLRQVMTSCCCRVSAEYFNSDVLVPAAGSQHHRYEK